MGCIILEIVAGVVAAFATITLTKYWVDALLPSRLDLVDRGGPAAALPVPLKLLVVAGWSLGALAGALLAARIALRSAIGWIPAALVALAASPTWR